MTIKQAEAPLENALAVAPHRTRRLQSAAHLERTLDENRLTPPEAEHCEPEEFLTPNLMPKNSAANPGEAAVNNSPATLEGFQAELEQQRRAAHAASAESALLREQLAQAQRELSELRAQANARAQQHALRYTQLRAQAVAQVRLDARQRAEVMAQLTAKVEQANRAQQALASAQDKIFTVQAALAQAEASCAQTKARLLALNQQLAAGERLCAEQARRATQAEREREALDGALSAAQRQAAELRAAVAAHQSTQRNLQVALASLQRQLLAREQQLSQVEQQAQAAAQQASDRLQTAVSRFLAERERLQSEVAALHTRLRQRDQHVAELAGQVETLAQAAQHRAAEWQASLTAPQAELDSVRAERQGALGPPTLADQPAAVVRVLRRGPERAGDALLEAPIGPAPVGNNDHGFESAPSQTSEAVSHNETRQPQLEIALSGVPQPAAAVDSQAPLAAPAPEPPASARDHSVSGARVEFDEQWLGSSTVFCPHLGLAEDPDTRHAFASMLNCCYRLDGTAAVGLAHQARYCLGGEHAACPVFKGSARHPRLPIDTDEAEKQPAGLGRRLSAYLSRGQGQSG